jgi:hypothetical protein
MRPGVLILFLVLFCNSSAFGYRYALVIGQNRGGASVENLHYAETDAKRCVTLLKTYAGFTDNSIVSLIGPDSNQVIRTIEKIYATIKNTPNPEHALFLLYYSGHADAEGLLLESTHLPFATLKKLVSDIPAGIKVAIFDACQSGAVVAFKGGVRAEPFFLSGQQKMNGEVWIASSSANERSQESETLKSSLFSFHLFNGLRGSADVSSDNKVTVSEAYQYAYHKTIETSALTSGIVQHPVYRFNISGEGDIVLTDLSDRLGGIIIDGSCSGTFLILSRNYTDVFADFKKGPDKETFIALPIGDYTVINARGGTDIGLFQFSVTKSQTLRCKASMFRASLLQEARLKGAKDTAITNDTTEGGGKYIVGAGIGVDLAKNPHNKDWDNDVMLSLYGSIEVFPDLNGYLTVYGTTLNKKTGITLGIEHTVFTNGSTDGFIGGGVGVQGILDARRHLHFDGPTLSLHAATEMRYCTDVKIGLILPCIIQLKERITYSVGFALRLALVR